MAAIRTKTRTRATRTAPAIHTGAPRPAGRSKAPAAVTARTIMKRYREALRKGVTLSQ